MFMQEWIEIRRMWLLISLNVYSRVPCVHLIFNTMPQQTQLSIYATLKHAYLRNTVIKTYSVDNKLSYRHNIKMEYLTLQAVAYSMHAISRLHI